MSNLEKDLRNAVEFIPGKLYYVALSAAPSSHDPQKHFFCIDNQMIYWNFYLDFGPLNLGHVYRFCILVNTKLKDTKLKDKTIYYYSSAHPHKRTNAAFLICAWAMFNLNLSPDDAFKHFKNFHLTFPPWHDATPTVCTYKLTILDTLRGLQRAREHNFFNFSSFDVEEYEHYEQVEHGDLNWLMEQKFIAFAGPHDNKTCSPGGYYNLRPEDYIPYFKRKNVTLVVRLNKPYYDARKFTSQGIDHLDLYFIDGSNPPEQILYKFIAKCEETSGAVAVHCKAGLGRTGTVIGCYMMKHFRFTADELIGWLRIVRPGSVIGPQQQFLKDMQQRMWRDGDLYRARLQQLGTLKPSQLQESSLSSSSGSGKLKSPSGSQKMSSPAPSTPNGVTRRMGKLSLSSTPTPMTVEVPLTSSGRKSGANTPLGTPVTSASTPMGSEKESQGDLLRMRRFQQAQGSPVLTPTGGSGSRPLSGYTSRPRSGSNSGSPAAGYGTRSSNSKSSPAGNGSASSGSSQLRSGGYLFSSGK